MMKASNTYSRRRFVGGMAAALGYLGLQPEQSLWAQRGGSAIAQGPVSTSEYDALAKLAYNENPYGPPESVLKAMTEAFKYANRYNYPEGGIVEAIARLHGCQPQNVVLGAGSTEILQLVANTFLMGGKRILGAEPTYNSVYEFATGLRGNPIRVPLRSDFGQDIPAMIKAAKDNSKDLGFVYLCNPNNPTGVIVTRDEVKQLLDGLPQGIPVLIDEAYHHYVESSAYGTSIPYVLSGRPVIIARTFSKISGMAGMRLGYGIAPAALVDRMYPFIGNMTVSAIAKWGGLAALKDSAAMEDVKNKTLQLRKKTIAQLTDLGYSVIPSETNFFMVNVRQQVTQVIRAFRQRGVMVGRQFPPMNQYLRVSVGNTEEMDRFIAAFKAIMPASTRR
jgi:histidinol-phosphate aminotransferase